MYYFSKQNLTDHLPVTSVHIGKITNWNLQASDSKTN